LIALGSGSIEARIIESAKTKLSLVKEADVSIIIKGLDHVKSR